MILSRLILGALVAVLPLASFAQRTHKPPLHGQD